MNKSEIRGLLKGMGIAAIIAGAIFYTMILNLRTDYNMALEDDTVIVEKARNMGMIFISESKDFDLITKDYIIKMARSYGMEFVEKEPE